MSSPTFKDLTIKTFASFLSLWAYPISIIIATDIQECLQKWYEYLRTKYSFFRTHRGRRIFKSIAHTIEIAFPIAVFMIQGPLQIKSFYSGRAMKTS